jgi:hypothetical protein
MIGSTIVIASLGALVIAQGQAAAQTTTAPPATTSATRPTLQIGGIVVRPDETRKGWVGNVGESDFEGYVWADADLCTFGADGKEPATPPYVGWYMKGHVVSKTADGLAAQINWQRMWDKGTRISDGARGSMQVSMRNGDMLQLDAAAPASSRCNTLAMRLEAVVSDGAEWLTLKMPKFYVVDILPRVKDTKQMKVEPIVTGGRSGARYAGVRDRAPGESYFWSYRGAGATSIDRFDVEIWLVHTPPGGAETAQRIALQSVQGGSRFAFPLVPVSSASGQVNVEFTGNVSVVVLNSTQELILNLSRRILVDGAGRTSHSGAKRIAMPAPTDVTSFELPPLTEAEQALIGGQRFSIRVKIGKTTIGTGGKD